MRVGGACRTAARRLRTDRFVQPVDARAALWGVQPPSRSRCPPRRRTNYRIVDAHLPVSGRNFAASGTRHPAHRVAPSQLGRRRTGGLRSSKPMKRSVTAGWMRFTSSLTNRVFLACALLAMLSLGFAFYFVNERATSEAEANLRQGLTEAAALVDQHRATLTDTLTRLARLVADLPKLKAAVATDDPPTVQPLAEEYLAEINADLLLLTSARNMVLGAAGQDAEALLPAVRDAPPEEELTTFRPHQRGVLEVVSVPILVEGELPDILGRLTVGFILDDELARQFKALTGSEIAFGAEGRILAATLPFTSRIQLAR